MAEKVSLKLTDEDQVVDDRSTGQAAAPAGIALEELDLTSWTENALASAGIRSVEEVLAKTSAELLQLPKFGRKGLNELQTALKDSGLELRLDDRTLADKLRTIGAEWRRRRSPPNKGSRGESACAYLKRSIYVVGLQLNADFSESAAFELVDQVRGRGRRGRAKTNLYHALLAATLDDKALKRVEKGRLARELSHAEAHRVPAEYLIGYLLQTAPSPK